MSNLFTESRSKFTKLPLTDSNFTSLNITLEELKTGIMGFILIYIKPQENRNDVRCEAQRCVQLNS